jgi:transketolase
VYLYSEFLKVNKENLNDPSRNYLFLSKGHDVPALYGTLAEFGIIDNTRLNNHLKTNDSIYWHPNTDIPGIEFHSGSLGHLLSVSIGVAIDIKLRKQANYVVVILGDGELNEGSIWEGFLVAAAKRLDNLIVVIDRNEFQANVMTESLVPLEPLDQKLHSFGFNVFRLNGHDFSDIHSVFRLLPFKNLKPSAIIADTVRGKGLPSIERRADRWFCNLTGAEVDSLLSELRGGAKTELVSQTLVVR